MKTKKTVLRRCSKCGKMMPVKRNGRLVTHGPGKQSLFCSGSGELEQKAYNCIHKEPWQKEAEADHAEWKDDYNTKEVQRP